jgi:hypothetical protein
VSRIYKAVREEAIEALLCTFDLMLCGVESSVEPVPAHHGLANVAWMSVRTGPWLLASPFPSINRHAAVAALDALEAAGLLLDGWNPGDPVVRR